MASSLFKANTKIPTKSLLSWITRHICNQDHCYGVQRNLMTIAWNNEYGFSGSLPVSETYKPQAEPIDLQTLKEKEKCDWRLLTMEEKRMLYDTSFTHPFYEVSAPEVDWKSILAGTFITMGLMTLGIYGWYKNYDKVKKHITFSQELSDCINAAYVGFVDGLPSAEVQQSEFVSNFIENKEMDSSFDCNSRL